MGSERRPLPSARLGRAAAGAASHGSSTPDATPGDLRRTWAPGTSGYAPGSYPPREAPLDPLYHDGHRRLQDRFDARRLADRIEERLVRDSLDEDAKAFVEGLDMFFLATADARGRPTCSYKGGDPGLVRVLDPATLAFPLYDGNGMFLSAGNLLANPEVGLLFLDFARGRRLRLEGSASVSAEDPLREAWPGAALVVRVRVRRVYPNCPRYVHRLTPVARSEFVPREGCTAPVPGWKRAEWARDVLPAGDPALGDPPGE